MKTLFTSCIVLASLVLHVYGQGSAFTYQGRVSDTNGPLNGNVALTFKIYMAEAAVLPVWQETHASVPVSNGIFAVTLGRIQPAGETLFTGDPRFMGISVNGSAELSPRTEITATPYAIAARRLTGVVASGGLAGVYSGAVHFNNSANRFSGDGGGLTNLNAATLGGQGASNFWQTSGNANTTPGSHFVGTTDNRPLELKVNGLRALRLEPTGDSSFDSGAFPDGAPNVVGGSASNFVTAGVVGATIAGGGATNSFGFARPNSIAGDYSSIGGGQNNSIESNAYTSTIGGGIQNRIGMAARYSTIAGGFLNDIGTNAESSFIGGGVGNDITNASYSAIAGGQDNSIAANAGSSFIGGGTYNAVSVGSLRSVITGGENNTISTNCNHAAIGGGSGNHINPYSFSTTIAGGAGNNVGTNCDYAAIGGGRINVIANNAFNSTIAGGFSNDIRSNSTYGAIGGGEENNIAANSPYGTISGGENNFIGVNSVDSAIGGGAFNSVANDSGGGTVAGGRSNRIGTNSIRSAIGGGFNNEIEHNSPYATIPGGEGNFATNRAFAAGRRAKANHTGAFVWADSQNSDFPSAAANQVSFRCQGGVRFTSGTALANQTVAWAPGAAAWSFSSDRNLKEGIKTIAARAVLEKVSRLPVTEWNYKGHSQRHIGPMAQDFHALFPLNDNDRMIDTGDLHGVALAALQGLNQKLEEELRRRDADNADLKRTVNELKELVGKLAERSSGGTR